MPNAKNKAQIELLQEKMSRAKSVILTDYANLPVKLQTKLRSEIKKAGGEFVVAKNTLMNRIVKKDEIRQSFNGQTAIVFSYEDEVAPLKVVVKFIDDNKVMQLKEGVISGQVMTVTQLTELSKLPGKQELIAQLLGRLNAPGSKLVGVLTASQRNLVYALQAISEKKI